MKKGDPIDIYVGARLRMQRLLSGLSQKELGAHLGITFQQIQKYEKGMNRVGASRLCRVAHILGVPISFFFDGVPVGGGGPALGFAETRVAPFVEQAEHTPETVELLRAFLHIKSPRVRRAVSELVKVLGEPPLEIDELS